jgi:hypothetical protein
MDHGPTRARRSTTAPDPALMALARAATANGSSTIPLELDPQGQRELEQTLASTSRRLAEIENEARTRLRSPGCDEAPMAVSVVVLTQPRD